MSSWIKSTVNKTPASRNNNNNNITRAVKNYADSVLHQAKIFQDRLVARNYRSVKKTVIKLEEAVMSCRGLERAVLLRRFLNVLNEVEKISTDELSPKYVKHKRKQPTMLYHDADVGGTPMTFCDVFLRSQALEGIIMSMILEAPTEEEIPLLLEMFGLCLTGEKEVHIAILSSMKDLSAAFASYEDEVLVKREDLLLFAQGAIAGLKVNADIRRIDSEVVQLRNKLDGLVAFDKPSSDALEKRSDETAAALEALKEALSRIRICSRLEALLLEKKSLNSGDTPDIHAQKVDQLKVLLKSLANSIAKAEQRIIDHRSQKEEALKVRVVKAKEADEREKEIVDEISILEKQQNELKAALEKVNNSLAAANVRLHNTQEERDHFAEANDQIIVHLKSKEDELSKSIAACKMEAGVLNTWINFLQDTWVLQCCYMETKEKQVSYELERHEDYFANLTLRLLSDYKNELGPSIDHIGTFVENLRKLSERSEMASTLDDEEYEALNPRKYLEEEYLDYEAKIVTTFSVVDNMRGQYYAKGAISRKDHVKVKELFDDLGKLRDKFESIERPILEMETPNPKSETALERHQEGMPHLTMHEKTTESLLADGYIKAPAVETAQVFDPAAELAKLELEFGKVGQDFSTEDIDDWEFDELERELLSGDTSWNK